MSDASQMAGRMWKHSGHQTFDFGFLDIEEIRKLRMETGLDFSGFRRVMATRGVRHALLNHGNAFREAQFNQFAVRPADFAKLPLIAGNGVAQLIVTTGGRKPARLEHRARFDDRVYVMLETIGFAKDAWNYGQCVSNAWKRGMVEPAVSDADRSAPNLTA